MDDTRTGIAGVIKACIWVAAGFAAAVWIVVEGISVYHVMRGGGRTTAIITGTWDDVVVGPNGGGGGIVTDAGYEFHVDGKRFGGRTSGCSLSVGDTLMVEYYPSDPSKNRPVGDRAVFGNFMMALLVGGFFTFCAMRYKLPTLRRGIHRLNAARQIRKEFFPGLRKCAITEFREGSAEDLAQAYKDDSLFVPHIIRRLQESSKPITPAEYAVMSAYMAKRAKSYMNATDRLNSIYDCVEWAPSRVAQPWTDATDQIPLEDAGVRAERDAAELAEIEDAAIANGSPGARALVARKMELLGDYTLAGMIRKHRAAQHGRPLSDKQLQRLRAQAAKYEQEERRG